MITKTEQTAIKEMLADADMVLVGIGEDFEENSYLRNNDRYNTLCVQIAEAGMQWVMPYVNHVFLKEDTRLQEAYAALGKALEGKNYFVISVSMNGYLRRAGLLEERVVEPCGSYFSMQCPKGCPESVSPVEKAFLEEVEACCNGEKEWASLQQPLCDCGAPKEFNSLYTEHYLEEGYQKQWNLYTKWLQGTLNRKLCVLELGAGMMFANVHRFRFEKIVGINQKSKLIRIHKDLYQLPEEIAERGVGISQNAVDFMAKMKEL